MVPSDIDRLFGELWGAAGRSPSDRGRAPVDVYVVGEPPTLVVELAVPGVDPADLDLSLHGDLLVIRGERRRRGGGRRMYHHAEIAWGPFERRLQLNVPVDPSAATASCERGLLVIGLPLAPRPPARRVEISVTTV